MFQFCRLKASAGGVGVLQSVVQGGSVARGAKGRGSERKKAQ